MLGKGEKQQPSLCMLMGHPAGGHVCNSAGCCSLPKGALPWWTVKEGRWWLERQRVERG